MIASSLMARHIRYPNVHLASVGEHQHRGAVTAAVGIARYTGKLPSPAEFSSSCDRCTCLLADVACVFQLQVE
jgi:hypothetical protein